MWAARNGRRMIFRVASDADCDPRRLLISFWRDRKLYEYGLRHAGAILAQSVRQQELLRNNYGVDSSLTASLVDVPERVLPSAERNISLLWVSNIQHWKRPEIFLDLAQRLPGCSATMIGGAVPKTGNLYRHISACAARVGNLTFQGQLPYRATNQVFDRARVFVNTSEFEGFPNTFLQAWVRGIPVVSFFDPDGVIRREGLGHAVASLHEMARAAEALTTDSQAWLEVSARCRAYMARRYGEDQIVAPYLSTLGRIAMSLPAAPAPV
jgi:glycosyltransferase involved in cell wall biosynthesis